MLNQSLASLSERVRALSLTDCIRDKLIIYCNRVFHQFQKIILEEVTKEKDKQI